MGKNYWDLETCRKSWKIFSFDSAVSFFILVGDYIFDSNSKSSHKSLWHHNSSRIPMRSAIGIPVGKTAFYSTPEVRFSLQIVFFKDNKILSCIKKIEKKCFNLNQLYQTCAACGPQVAPTIQLSVPTHWIEKYYEG